MYIERCLEAGQGFLAPIAVDHHADADLAGVNHADVDVALGQSPEHPPGHPGMRSHADAQHKQLGNVRIRPHDNLRIDRGH